MMEDTLALLRFNCPQLNCDYLGTGWADLKKHARNEHGLVFCDLCTKHKKIFSELSRLIARVAASDEFVLNDYST